MSSLTLLLARKELVDVSIWCNNRNEFSGTFDAHKVYLTLIGMRQGTFRPLVLFGSDFVW